MKMDPSTGKNRALFERFHIDLPLLLGIFALMGFWSCDHVQCQRTKFGDDGSPSNAHGIVSCRDGGSGSTFSTNV